MNRLSRLVVPLILAACAVAVGQDNSNADATKAEPQPPQRVRVSSGVSTGLLIKKVTPHYPDEALRNHIQGTVVMTALISKAGDVEELKLVSGHPSLAPAALEAVKKWKYRPYIFHYNPVAIETQVVVNFQLSSH